MGPPRNWYHRARPRGRPQVKAKGSSTISPTAWIIIVDAQLP